MAKQPKPWTTYHHVELSRLICDFSAEHELQFVEIVGMLEVWKTRMQAIWEEEIRLGHDHPDEDD